ncbi:dihydrofolate synthase / folylpolyglutamate synthase [Epsilonproteobacteria bacterium SCGC AD-308-P11]|nr:dihydrofolate synthase / folylpolyglutamate synthase [Epsilonproteobacteria bacterium SCGC AD-308-P11]
MILQDFLDAKPLYYDEIDYARMPKVYEKIKSHFTNVKIIHLIGTNAKGTTGRFLASALHAKGYKTGHFTSPHISVFNERIWLDGKNISDGDLEESHQKLLILLSDEDASSLSYFEYTTFLAMIAFKESEYIVLEAGLGGEHDATAVFDKILTLVTPIGMDHEAFLGNTITEIATTKMNAIQNNAILAFQNNEEVYRAARNIALKKEVKIYNMDEFIDERDEIKIQNISKQLSLPPYLQDNLSLAISALKFLNIEYTENDFNDSKLFGRLSKLSENILVDVGHNVLAASSILTALSGEKYILVYNSYKDKNYKEILTLLKPIILHVEIIDIQDKRIVEKELLQSTLEELDIQYTQFKKTNKDYKYLVFGSFSVVEKFLNLYKK